MLKKQAKDLKKGDKINIATEDFIIESIELSDIGKQGIQKCRIIAIKSNGEKIIIIRPSNYPFNVK